MSETREETSVNGNSKGYSVSGEGHAVSVVMNHNNNNTTLQQPQQEQDQQQEQEQHQPQDQIEPHLSTAPSKMEWGRKNGLTIDFRDVNLSVVRKDTKNRLQILKGIDGCILPSRLMIILGPSGSGKTSLLSVLAGRTRYVKSLSLTGNFFVNGNKVNWTKYRRQVAFVEQDDALFPLLTVRETLMFAAEMRLPESVSEQSRESYVEDIIAELGLVNVADTRIGNSSARGVSGGERKRVNVGVEIISGPQAIFADEPTSGLDAFASLNVMQVLKQLAETGRTVVASVHQPRSSIFALADDVIVMSQGEMAYHGPGDQLVPYLASMSYECPQHFSPSDFVIDLVSRDFRSEGLVKQTMERVQTLNWQFANSSLKQETLAAGAIGDRQLLPETSSSVDHPSAQSKNSSDENKEKDAQGHVAKYQSGVLKQFRLLFQRAVRNRFRSMTGVFAPVVVAFIFGLLLGSVYYDTPLTQFAIQDRIGVLFFITLNQAFNGMLSSLNTFGRERDIVNRERAAKSYRVGPYFLSRSIVDMPFSVFGPWVICTTAYWLIGLGPTAAQFFRFVAIITLVHFTAVSLGLVLAAAFDTAVAASVGPPILIILMLFSGFYAATELIPDWIGWIQWVSPVRYGFSGVVLNEFEGLEFKCENEGDAGDAGGGTGIGGGSGGGGDGSGSGGEDDTDVGCIPNGEAVILRLGFENDSMVRSSGLLIVLTIALQFGAYLVLRVNKPTYITPSSAPASASASANAAETAVAQQHPINTEDRNNAFKNEEEDGSPRSRNRNSNRAGENGNKGNNVDEVEMV